MKLSSRCTSGGAVLLAAALVVGTGALSRRMFLTHAVHAAVAQGSPAAGQPGPVSRRAYGWHQLKLLRSVDPGNPQSTSWLKWSNKCFLAPGLRPPASGDSRMNLAGNCANVQGASLPAGLQLSTQNADPQEQRLGSVYFNAKAAEAVLKNGLGIQGGGPDVLRPVAGQAMDKSLFPKGSMVVKAIWELVPITGSAGSRVGSLHYYDPAVVKPDGNNELPQLKNWPTLTLAVDSPACNFGPGVTKKISANDVVPLGCFITNPSVALDSDLVPSLVNHLGVASCVSQCVLVLVGLHVAHKKSDELRDWTWTTFWWTNDPAADSTHFNGHTPGLPAVYTHFVMDTSYANPGVMYNPYQEGSQGPAGATVSHCAGCHDHAATETGLNGGASPVSFPISKSGSYAPVSCPPGEVCTDAIWSIATSRGSTGLIEFVNFELPGGRSPAVKKPH